MSFQLVGVCCCSFYGVQDVGEAAPCLVWNMGDVVAMPAVHTRRSVLLFFGCPGVFVGRDGLSIFWCSWSSNFSSGCGCCCGRVDLVAVPNLRPVCCDGVDCLSCVACNVVVVVVVGGV